MDTSYGRLMMGEVVIYFEFWFLLIFILNSVHPFPTLFRPRTTWTTSAWRTSPRGRSG